MKDPVCLNLAKKVVRLLERTKGVPVADKQRALRIAAELLENGWLQTPGLERKDLGEEEK